MGADGSIVIKTKVEADDAQAAKELERLNRKIEKLEKTLDEKRAEESAFEKLRENAAIAEEKLKALREEYAALQDQMDPSKGMVGFDDVSFEDFLQMQSRMKELPDLIKDQEAAAQQAGKAYEKVREKSRETCEAIEDTKNALQQCREEAGEITRRMSTGSEVAGGTSRAMKTMEERTASVARNIVSGTEATEEQKRKLQEYADLMKNVVSQGSKALKEAEEESDSFAKRFTNRIKALAKRVLIFSVITAALRHMRNWLGNVIQTNDEAAAAMARLKGALLTLAQPLLSVLIPVLTVVINLLARLVTVAAQLMAMIFGKSIKQTSAAAKAMNAEKTAIEGVGSAAKETAKNLSGLDEINTWDSGSSGGGGGGASSGGISPDFDLDGMGVAEDRLKDILGLVEAIAAGLLTWKLSKMFGLNLGQSLALFAAIIGAVEFVKGLFDAWANGASAENVRQMMIGLTVAAVGLGIAFGPVAAGVALVVGGLAMLVTGFQDAVKNGFNLHNMLLTLAGIIATGLGISLLTGSVIPVLIASILALLVAIAVFTGHGEELLNGLRDVFGGFIDFITGVFSGDWAKAMGGIERMFQGLKMALGAIIDGVKDLFLRFLDWIDQKTNGKLKPILDFIRNCVKVTFDAIKTTVGNVVDAVKQIFSGIITFLRGVFTGNWKMAWDGIKSVFKGVWNGVVSILEGAVNLIIRGVNWLVSQLNKIHVDIPSWVPGIGGRSVGINIPSVSYVSIPRLAKGAVIPPNREFMAVLGDQKSGNNIETPESLLRQIVREEMSNKDGGSYRFTAQINRRTIFDEVIEEGKMRQVSTGKNPFTTI